MDNREGESEMTELDWPYYLKHSSASLHLVRPREFKAQVDRLTMAFYSFINAVLQTTTAIGRFNETCKSKIQPKDNHGR